MRFRNRVPPQRPRGDRRLLRSGRAGAPPILDLDHPSASETCEGPAGRCEAVRDPMPLPIHRILRPGSSKPVIRDASPSSRPGRFIPPIPGKSSRETSAFIDAYTAMVAVEKVEPQFRADHRSEPGRLPPGVAGGRRNNSRPRFPGDTSNSPLFAEFAHGGSIDCRRLSLPGFEVRWNPGEPSRWQDGRDSTEPATSLFDEDKHDGSLRSTAGCTPFVRAPDRIGPVAGGRSARTRHDGGRGPRPSARFAPPHGLRPPADDLARPVRPCRAGPATLLRSGPVPRHLRGGRHRRAGRPGARIRAQRRGERLARPGQHPVRHRIGDQDVHRPRRPAPLPGEPGHVPPARPRRPDQRLLAQHEIVQAAPQVGPDHHEGAARHDQRPQGCGGPQSWQEQLKAISKDRLLYTPGTESSYSSANYDLLGELIEQWTGQSYGNFIQDQILAPLGMSSTQVLSGTRHGPGPGGRLQPAPARQVAEGRAAERTRRCTRPPASSRRPRTWPPI